MENALYEEKNKILEGLYGYDKKEEKECHSPVDGPQTKPTIDRSDAKKAIDRKQTKDTGYTVGWNHTESRPTDAI